MFSPDNSLAIGPRAMRLAPASPRHAGRSAGARRGWPAAGCAGRHAAAARDVHGRPRLDAPCAASTELEPQRRGPAGRAGPRRARSASTWNGCARGRARWRWPSASSPPPRRAGCRALPADGAGAAFLRLWCAKEAVLKAHGRGIAFGLDRLGSPTATAPGRWSPAIRHWAQPADWTLHAFMPMPGYLASARLARARRSACARWSCREARSAPTAGRSYNGAMTDTFPDRTAHRTRRRPARARPRHRARRAAAGLPRPARALEPDLQPDRDPRSARDGVQAPARLAGDASASSRGIGTPGRPRHRRRPARHPAGDRHARRCR